MAGSTVSTDIGKALPRNRGSLALGVPTSAAGTLYAQSVDGGISIAARAGRTVVFGRNGPDVHVCVGENDRKVSREQGRLTYRDQQWWLANTGRLPGRLPGGRLLFSSQEPFPLDEGYTPVFFQGSGRREHLLELYVADQDGTPPGARHQDPTQPPRVWRLSTEERLALVVLGQRYLLNAAYPQPLTWREVASELAELQPDAAWTPKKVEHLVVGVRKRLSRGGVAGLTREEVGEPVGNALNHNLIGELLLSTTLVPFDLALLDEPVRENPPERGAAP